jgi:phosphonoacetate hydrolase
MNVELGECRKQLDSYAGQFVVNKRTYRLPQQPVAAICLDGCSDDYLDSAIAAGLMPRTAAMVRSGFRAQAAAAIPTFTNVNNVSLVTGVSPAEHGISGNFFLDPGTRRAVMMDAPEYLRAPSILAAAADHGRKVAIVSAKEKLRRLLGRGCSGIAFSAECASLARRETHGIDRVEELVAERQPEIYSPEASLYVLRAGAVLLRAGLADFLYLSLTDYVQHRWAPSEVEAQRFMAKLDAAIGELLDLGARVGATADHGMNAKHGPDGTPNVIYLETELTDAFGEGAEVVLPITDPYVAHHGALGSYACVHLPDISNAGAVASHIAALPGITEVYPAAEAAFLLELPQDRIGDLVVLADRHTVIGRTPGAHDLSALHGPLRSHGGRFEQVVPLLLSEPPPAEVLPTVSPLRNFDLFHLLLPP